MSAATLTCDRANGLWRVAVWRGKELHDLYLDRIASPDLTGAVARGKIVRVLPGQTAAYVDAELGTMIYVDGLEKAAAGMTLTVTITSTARQGKAWVGRVYPLPEDADANGILVSPPLPWERALRDLKGAKIAALRFADREDFTACSDPRAQSSKEPVHPELDDILDNLRQPHVPLPQGGSLVIETTEALTAIDVNAGESNNPLAVNLLAVREAARQMRLRNLGGIIVMDALKMKQRTDHAKVLNAMTRATAEDPAGVQVFGLTKLGLLEMTRTRRGPSLEERLDA